MGRKNINRGFKRLRVWQDVIHIFPKFHCEADNNDAAAVFHCAYSEKDCAHDCRAIVIYWGWYWSGCLSLIAILCGILYSCISWESYRKKEKTLRTLLPITSMVISILLIIWAIERLAMR